MGVSSHTALLFEDGTVNIFGRNDFGQCGTGNTTSPCLNINNKLNLTGIKQISCGTSHTVLLFEDGTVNIFGRNDSGQCGTGDKVSPQLNINNKLSFTGVKQVSCGSYHTALLFEDGTVNIFGYNDYGQCGTGNTTSPCLNINNKLNLTGIKQISCNNNTTALLFEDGTVNIFGINQYGQCGTGNTTSPCLNINNKLTFDKKVKQVSCGDGHTTLLFEDSTVNIFGYNDYGQCGTGNTTSPCLNINNKLNLTGIKQISCNNNTTALLFEDGTVNIFGINQYGQCGTGNTTSTCLNINNKLSFDKNIKQISCGNEYTVLLFKDGTVNIFGRNDSGQCGTGSVTATSPYAITNINNKLNLINIKSLFDIQYNINEKFVIFSLPNTKILPNNTLSNTFESKTYSDFVNFDGKAYSVTDTHVFFKEYKENFGILDSDTNEQIITKIKAWIQTNNIKIIGKAKTPTTENITFNRKLKTFKGNTYVKSNTTVDTRVRLNAPYVKIVPLTKVINVKSSIVSGKVTLTWDSVVDANIYNIYVDGKKVGESTINSYVFANEVQGNITVKALNKYSESPDSDQLYVKTVPNKPINVSLEKSSDTSNYILKVGFIDNSTIETGYRIKYTVDSGSTTTIDIPSVNSNGTAIERTITIPEINSKIVIDIVSYNDAGENGIIEPITIYMASQVDFMYDTTLEKYIIKWNNTNAECTKFKIRYTLDGNTTYRYIDFNNAIVGENKCEIPYGISGKINYSVCSIVNSQEQLYTKEKIKYTYSNGKCVVSTDKVVKVTWDNIHANCGYKIVYSINDGAEVIQTIPSSSVLPTGNKIDIPLGENTRVKVKISCIISGVNEFFAKPIEYDTEKQYTFYEDIEGDFINLVDNEKGELDYTSKIIIKEIHGNTVLDNVDNPTKMTSVGTEVVLTKKMQTDVIGVEWDVANFTTRHVLYENEISFKLANGFFNTVAPWKNIKRVILNDSGQVVKTFGESGYIEDGSLGQVMVQIPKFYYKVVPLKLETVSNGTGQQITKGRWYISARNISGFKVHPMFIKNGVEVDYAYVSAFNGCAYSTNRYLLNDEQIVDFYHDKLSSIAGAKPISGSTQQLTIENARRMVTNRGSGWKLQDFATLSGIQMLMFVEYGSFDSQSLIGNGVVNIGDDGSTNMSLVSGLTSSLGNTSGYVGENGRTSVSYRGIENLWGNIRNYVDGINIEAKGLHKSYWSNGTFASDTSTNYTPINFTLSKSNGYVSKIGYDEPNDFIFLPTENLGASNKPINDNLTQDYAFNGWKVMLSGGMWSSASNAGLFNLGIENDKAIYSRSISARLIYK